MLQLFLIALREAVQLSLVISLLLLYPAVRDNRKFTLSLLAGVAAAFAVGFPMGYASYEGNLMGKEAWTTARFASEAVALYLGVAVIALSVSPRRAVIGAGLFLFGLYAFFFEARALGFLTCDIGLAKGSMTLAVFATVAGTAMGLGIGLGAVIGIKRLSSSKSLPLEKLMSLPGLLILTGALKLSMGGVGEIEEAGILLRLQQGIASFLGEAMGHLQSTLMLKEHPFMAVPLSGLFRFVSGESTAMAVTVLFVMLPPLYALLNLFARAEPVVSGIPSGAERRLKVTFFRKELLYQAVPALTAFFTLIVLIHAVNIALNPLYEPLPIPLREAGDSKTLMIPVSDKMGDLTDGRLRKYVYYYSSKQIIFLAIVKPDGTVGVALDQCEICKPADWNKSAQGYAQSGGSLICKYCMTPIAIPTVNKPGGCNPIPLPFKVEDNHIVIPSEDLIRVFKAAEALEKKGIHL